MGDDAQDCHLGVELSSLPLLRHSSEFSAMYSPAVLVELGRHTFRFPSCWSAAKVERERLRLVHVTAGRLLEGRLANPMEEALRESMHKGDKL